MTTAVADLYTNKYKTLLREIKEDLSLSEVHCFCGLEDSVLLRNQLPLNLFIDLMQSQSKSQIHSFVEIN